MIDLSPFAETHLDGALRLSQAVRWPHRREDWAMVAALSQGVAALDGDRVIGTALSTPMGDTAALNMIIVADDCQGKGLGRQLMEQVIALAGPRRMTLVATPEGLPLYEKLGFVATGAIVQYQGVAASAPDPALPMRRGGAGDLGAVAALDLAATGADRRALLGRIIAEGALFLTAGGFACRRDFGRGQVIGPIVAPDAATAQALVFAAAAGCAGRFLRVDTPAGAGLEPALAALGLPAVGGGTEMCRTTPASPATPARPGAPHRFALISQALG